MHWSPANMFNTIAVLGVSALIVTANIDNSPGVDPITTATTAKPAASPRNYDRFMVFDHALSKSCLFALHRAEGYDVHRVEPGIKCQGIAEGLANARIWHESPQGTVTVADGSGQTIMKLAPADGFAYDVIEPKNLALSLEAF